jgi:hypothetical protein
MLLITAPQLVLVLWAKKWSWLARTLAATAMFPLIGLIVALCFGVADSYWAP